MTWVRLDINVLPVSPDPDALTLLTSHTLYTISAKANPEG